MSDGLEFKLSDDHSSLTVTIPSEPAAVMTLRTGEVEAFISVLGQMRTRMKPEINRDWTREPPIQIVADPRWAVELESSGVNSVVHLRDPRFGWLHYLLPPSEAKAIGGYLQSHAHPPAPSTDQDQAIS